ncbi:TIGR03086 family metal-binding protein [Salininema proteolyticum]|uniref:TIGR03086 family metal-binding protein n=1 Tax=Salininema proteolyticum TaxID=1607685 RepID=A0ABV8TWE9_9ACTN
MSDELIGGLEGSQKAFAGALDALGADEWGAATPCEGWTVRHLVAHLVDGDRMFRGLLVGERAGITAFPDVVPLEELEVDPAAVYRAAAREVLAEFRRPGVLERPFRFGGGEMPLSVGAQMRLVDLVGHSWDLERATGRAVALPDGAVERTLVFLRRTEGSIHRGPKGFAEAEPVPDGASPMEEIAAILGRSAGQ